MYKDERCKEFEVIHREYISWRIGTLTEGIKVTHEIFYEDTHINLSRKKRGKGGTNSATISSLCVYHGISIPEFYNCWDEFYSTHNNKMNK